MSPSQCWYRKLGPCSASRLPDGRKGLFLADHVGAANLARFGKTPGLLGYLAEEKLKTQTKKATPEARRSTQPFWLSGWATLVSCNWGWGKAELASEMVLEDQRKPKRDGLKKIVVETC